MAMFQTELITDTNESGLGNCLILSKDTTRNTDIRVNFPGFEGMSTEAWMWVAGEQLSDFTVESARTISSTMAAIAAIVIVQY